MAGLHRNERLKKRNRIARLHRSGRLLRGNNLDIFLLRSQSRQVAFAAARSCGGAVVRNRVKRRLREAFRQRKHLFDRHRHYFIVGKAGVLDCTMESLLWEMAAMAAKVANHEKDSS